MTNLDKALDTPNTTTVDTATFHDSDSWLGAMFGGLGVSITYAATESLTHIHDLRIGVVAGAMITLTSSLPFWHTQRRANDSLNTVEASDTDDELIETTVHGEVLDQDSRNQPVHLDGSVPIPWELVCEDNTEYGKPAARLLIDAAQDL